MDNLEPKYRSIGIAILSAILMISISPFYVSLILACLVLDFLNTNSQHTIKAAIAIALVTIVVLHPVEITFNPFGLIAELSFIYLFYSFSYMWFSYLYESYHRNEFFGFKHHVKGLIK